jgi:glycosyltransferase involved in cell wall biosynthesis
MAMPSSISAQQSGQATTRQAHRVPVTVVIPTLNEADRIADIIASLAFADEIVVVDGGSTDSTSSIAKDLGANVLVSEGPTIAAQRNRGIASARNEWILALDADERPTPELVNEVAAVLRSPTHDAYRIRFRNFYGGRELRHGQWARDWHVRLFRRQYRFLERRVHERLEDVSSVGTLRGEILHTPYRDFHDHIQKVVRYSQLGAEDLRRRGARITAWHLLVRPAWRFTREYIFYGAFRAGRLGIVTAATSALAAFLKYAFAIMPAR